MKVKHKVKEETATIILDFQLTTSRRRSSLHRAIILEGPLLCTANPKCTILQWITMATKYCPLLMVLLSVKL